MFSAGSLVIPTERLSPNFNLVLSFQRTIKQNVIKKVKACLAPVKMKKNDLQNVFHDEI